MLALPFMASAIAGLRGRVLGSHGAQMITTVCLLLSAGMSLVAFYEVAICRSPVTIVLGDWLTVGNLHTQWSFSFDDLTVAMLLPVLCVSSMVHVYSCSYMESDPHTPRFFSYLSLFTASMAVLVSADSYTLMFVGWELIGVASYLLIGFWLTRIQAQKSAIKAMCVNRVGDTLLSIGFFACLWCIGSLDYATVLSVGPMLNETSITIIALLFLGGAMSKSAQLPLQTWLADAMEGFSIRLFYDGIVLVVIQGVFSLLCIAVMCDESTCVLMASLPPLVMQLDPKVRQMMLGNILGDASIQCSRSGACRLMITAGMKHIVYLTFLFNTLYKPFCSPEYKLNEFRDVVRGYWQVTLCTLTTSLFAELHAMFYVWDKTTASWVKIVPVSIVKWLCPVSLAILIADDGTFDNTDGVLLLCVEGFTKDECLLIIQALARMGIKAGLKARKTSYPDQRYRIRVSRHSMAQVRTLCLPHLHPHFHYKLRHKGE